MTTTKQARFPGVSPDASELLTKLANATVTYYECSGHSKANRNEWAIKEYKEQLTKMKVPIPDDKELLELGVFNGEGSK